jgi:hypothetical protein
VAEVRAPILRVIWPPRLYALVAASPPTIWGDLKAQKRRRSFSGGSYSLKRSHIGFEELLMETKVRDILMLAAAGVATAVGPILLGLLNAPEVSAQAQREHIAFEVASVKPNNSSEFRNAQFQFLPGGKLLIKNVPLLMIVADAYNIPLQSPRLTGGPDWERAASEKYDIEELRWRVQFHQVFRRKRARTKSG